jgi:hypothetical protein
MLSKIINNNQEIISSTKRFLSQYLAKKNKVENEIYLSFYLSEDNKDSPESRGVRFIHILREVELTLKNQLNPKLAKILLDQLQRLRPAEAVRSNKMSIAFFISESFAGFILIPFPVFENVVVARSLHLKPILSWIKSGDQFYLITLSSKLCRLLKGDSFSLTEINSVTLSSIEYERNKNISDMNIKLKLVFQAEENFYQFVKYDNFPIIIGGTAELLDLYKRVNRDPDVLKERIVGNLDRSTFQDLHKDCLTILSTIRTNNDQMVLTHYQEMKYCGKVIEELNEITIAAIQGRIRNLIIASDRFLWGSLDKTTGKITSHINKDLAIPEDDIWDDLAEIVIARGGAVTLLKHNEMPSDSEAIALLK